MKLFCLTLLSFLFLLVTAGAGYAGSAGVPVPVTAEIVGDCTVTTDNINFSYISGGAASTVTASVNVNCTNTLSYNIELDSGLYPGDGYRAMADTMNSQNEMRLNYDLYHDDCSSPWYTGALGLSGTGNGMDQSYTVCGKVFSNQEVIPGTYQDTITVHVMIE